MRRWGARDYICHPMGWHSQITKRSFQHRISFSISIFEKSGVPWSFGQFCPPPLRNLHRPLFILADLYKASRFLVNLNHSSQSFFLVLVLKCDSLLLRLITTMPPRVIKFRQEKTQEEDSHQRKVIFYFGNDLSKQYLVAGLRSRIDGSNQTFLHRDVSQILMRETVECQPTFVFSQIFYI